MMKFLTALLVATLLTGCSALTPKRVDQIQTVVEVAYLADNYKSMQEALLALPLAPNEKAALVAGLNGFEALRRDVSALADGKIDSDTVLDYATGSTLLVRIRDSYNLITQGALNPFHLRTGWQPPQEFMQYQRVSLQIWSRLESNLKTDRSLKVRALTGMLMIISEGMSKSVVKGAAFDYFLGDTI